MLVHGGSARHGTPVASQGSHRGPAEERPHCHGEERRSRKAAARLTFEQKAELMHKVVLAVEFLHQGGMLHRDLKPANILVGADLERVSIFGLALDLGIRPTAIENRRDGRHARVLFQQAAGGNVGCARSDVFSARFFTNC